MVFGCFALFFLAALFFWLRPDLALQARAASKASAARDSAAFASLPSRTLDLPQLGLKLQPRFVGYAQTTRDTSGLGEKIVAALDRVKKGKPDPTPHPAQPPEIDTSKLPAHCFSKPPKLSAAQKATLARLRWGPTKELQYRGDGDDATVRFLASPMLIAPLDLRAPKTEPAEQLARRFVAEARELFLLRDPASELQLLRQEADGLGGQVVRFQQTYGGLEVWPAQLTANVSVHGYLTTVTAAYAPTPAALDLVPRLTPDDALAAAAARIGAANVGEAVVHSAPKLKIYTEKSREPALSYETILEAKGRHERIFVDAHTGEVLAAISEICEAAAVGSGTDILGQTKSLNVYASGSPAKYYLYDTTKPMFSGMALTSTAAGYIAIYNGATTGYQMLFSNTLTGGYDAEGVGAAYNLGKVYDFFSSQFSRNSWDGNGAAIRAYVYEPNRDDKGNVIGAVLNNAFWNGQRMGFGTGDRYTASSDVIAHEMTHAVIQQTANLIYQAESGALNESMADVFGESHERWLNAANDWLIGSQLSSPGRSMSDPAAYQQPAKMSGFVVTDSDHGGVHINSGIPNRAFYLLAEGLSTGAIGLTAARNIFWRALATKLNPNSRFHDLRTACVQSAIELHGAGSTQVLKTQEAFNAVEIFDQSAPPTPSNLTPAAGPNSCLFVYQSSDGNYYLGRNEAAQGDGASLRALSPYVVSTDTRVAVTADGAVAAHVTASHNLVLTATNASSTANAQWFDTGGTLNSLAVSADGNHLAVTYRNATTGAFGSTIGYLNFNTGTSETINLAVPVGDGSSTTSIGVVDEVDLSPDGRFALVDGFSETQLADGTTIQGWTVFAVDLSSKAVFAISPPLNGIAIGNPSFSRTYAGRFTFEITSSSGSAIVALDLALNQSATVRSFAAGQSFMAYPRYSAADDFITYTDEFFSLTYFSDRPRVSLIALANDKINSTGSPVTLWSYAQSGLSYRRGTFAGAPVLTISAQQTSVTGGSIGTFRIARPSGDQATSLGVSFKAIGTAIPKTDYQLFTLNAIISANQSYVDVPFTALIPPGSSNKTLTLALDPQFHYAVSPSAGSASMTLVAAPWSYSYWQSTFVPAIGGATSDDDSDGLNNLLEYALGTDPLATSGVITSANYLTIEKVSAGGLVFAQLRLKRTLVREGVTFTLQRSLDNSTWTDAGTAEVSNTASELVLRDSLAVQFSQARYFRLRIAESATGATMNSLTCYWAGFVLSNLAQTYDGQPKSITVTTVPANVNHIVTYDGSQTAPTNAGSYAAFARAANYGNLIGESSGTLTVSKATQSIDFPTPQDGAFSKQARALSATASSNLPVGFAIIVGPATVTGTQLTPSGVGIVTVRASQSGDLNFLPAPDVDRSFRVLSSFDAWRLSEFPTSSTDDAMSGPNVTLRGEELSNLMRYALGLTASDRSQLNLPSLTLRDGRWVFTYVRPTDRSDLVYSVEMAASLGAQTEWQASPVVPQLVSTNGELETWETSFPTASSGAVFFRLRVTR